MLGNHQRLYEWKTFCILQRLKNTFLFTRFFPKFFFPESGFVHKLCWWPQDAPLIRLKCDLSWAFWSLSLLSQLIECVCFGHVLSVITKSGGDLREDSLHLVSPRITRPLLIHTIQSDVYLIRGKRCPGPQAPGSWRELMRCLIPVVRLNIRGRSHCTWLRCPIHPRHRGRRTPGALMWWWTALPAYSLLEDHSMTKNRKISILKTSLFT